MSSVYADVIVDITNEKAGPDLSVQGSAGTDRGDQSGNGGTDSVWKRKPHDHRLCAFRRKRAEISAGPDEGHPRGTKGCGDRRDEAHRARRVDASYVRIDDDPGVKDGASSQSKGARERNPAKLRFLQILRDVRSCWKTTERKL